MAQQEKRSSDEERDAFMEARGWEMVEPGVYVLKDKRWREAPLNLTKSEAQTLERMRQAVHRLTRNGASNAG